MLINLGDLCKCAFICHTCLSQMFDCRSHSSGNVTSRMFHLFHRTVFATSQVLRDITLWAMALCYIAPSLNLLSHDESNFYSMYIQSILQTVNINIYCMLSVATYIQSFWLPVTGLLSHRPEDSPEPLPLKFLV